MLLETVLTFASTDRLCRALDEVHNFLHSATYINQKSRLPIDRLSMPSMSPRCGSDLCSLVQSVVAERPPIE
jgi:hypothetical protein